MNETNNETNDETNNETNDNEQCCEEIDAGQSCSCSSGNEGVRKAAGKRTPKAIVSLAVLLAVISIVAFRTSTLGNNDGNDMAGFDFGQTTPDTTDKTDLPAPAGLAAPTGATDTTETMDPTDAKETTGNTEPADSTAPAGPLASSDSTPLWAYAFPEEPNLGEYIGSFDELDSVSADTDAVFIYIPAPGNVLIDETAKANIVNFQQDLLESGIKAVLYTFSCNSPDYDAISESLELPLLYIARRGASAITIPGAEVDEYMLFQAYQVCCDTSSVCCR